MNWQIQPLALRETIMKKATLFGRNTILRWAVAVVTILSSTLGMAGPIGLRISTAQSMLPQAAAAATRSATQSVAGQSQTLLPSGGMLLIGGRDANGVRKAALLQDAQTGTTTLVSAHLQYARAWHTATLLPDGSVLILGGIGNGGTIVGTAERLNAAGTAFQGIGPVGLTRRAYHSATLQADGRVLIAGGIGADGATLGSVELWDSASGQSTTLPIELLTPRSQHTATLLPDGTVLLWGGVDAHGAPLPYGEIIDPVTATVRMQATPLQPSSDPQPPQLEASLPQNGATGVPVNVLLSLRFSKPLSVTTVNTSSVVLSGPGGVVPVKVIPAEGGMLVFVTPQATLESGAFYTLSLVGLMDNGGQALPDSSTAFTTAGGETATAGSSGSGLPGDTGQFSPSQESPASIGATSGSTAVADASSQPSSAPSSTAAALAPTTRGYVSRTHLTFEQVQQAISSAQQSEKSTVMVASPMTSAGCGIQGDPEIVALAQALKNDPDLIYQYVHDNIEFDPLYGALKGPVGTLLDGRGDAFDQAALMVALLNQAAYATGCSTISNVNFEIGKINLSSSLLKSWLGGDGSQGSIESILDWGGIPYTSVDSSGNVTGMGHVWVQVTIGSGTYVFDPAFKSHTWTTGLVSSLASIMGYSQTSFVAAAGSPTVTSDSIQGVNRAQLRSTLTTYANSLASYIKTNLPAAGVSDIVGGGTIVPAPLNLSNGQTVRQSLLSYQNGAPAASASIPTGYCATLSITLPDLTTPTKYYSENIYGHRLSIFFNVSYVPSLCLDGNQCVSGSAAPPVNGVIQQVGITFSVTIPWATSFSYQHKQNIDAQTNSNNAGYIVMNGWDQVGRGMIEKHRKMLNLAIASGTASNSELALGESLEVEGYTWLAEVAAQQQLSDQLLGTKTQYYYGVGIVGEAVGKSGTTGPYVDLPMNQVQVSARVNGASGVTPIPSQIASTLDESGTSSSFESATLEQLQALVPGFQAASTVKLIDVALQQNYTIYDINPSNWATIQGSLSNYKPGDISVISTFLNQGAANTSYRVIAPSNGAISLCPTNITNCTSSTIPNWTGVGYKTMETTVTSSSFGFGYGEQISGGLSGGFSVAPAPPSVEVPDACVAQPLVTGSLTGNISINASTGISKAGMGGDPLDLVKGSYQYQHNDLAVSAKSFPYGLSFERSYDSGAQGIAGPLGNGWSHNYAITAKVNSDGFAGMGQASPLSAVSSIVALYVSSDLVSANTKNGQSSPSPNNVPLEIYVLETVVNRWFTDRLTNNVVNVAQGWNSEEFTLMANGSYVPPLGSATILDVNGGNFRYRSKAGVTMNFNSSGQISSWTNAAGASVNFSYSGTNLSTVANSATGRTLTLNYSGNQVTSVTDGSRTVSYGHDTSGNLTTFTDALSQNTTFSYDTSGSYDTAGHLTQVFYPSNPSNPFVTNFYDSLGRVQQQKDADGNLTQAFFAGARTEVDDPAGNRHVWYNDPRGNVLEEIQDYGPSPHFNMTTVNTYGGQGQLLTTTMPEGNSVVYSNYDAYFNPLTITQYPKASSSLKALVQAFTYTQPVSSLPNFEEVKTITDPNLNVTYYNYDSTTGNLLEIDQPVVPEPGVGNSTPKQVFTYTGIGLVQTATDAEGRVTRYDYDSSHADQVFQLTADYGRLNLVTKYGYDSYGDVNSVTDANNHATSSIFDNLRRLTEVDAPVNGAVTKYTYFADGQVCSVSRQVATGSQAPACNQATNGSWETTQYTYTLSDKVNVVTDPLGNKTTTTYDADDRVQTVTQQVSATLNRQRTYSYDALSRLYQLSDTTSGSPGTVLETHAYTLNGKEQSFTDANNHAIRYIYDGFDRLDHTTYPDTATEQYQYDANGNVLLKTARSGQTIAFTYDALNRVATKTPQGEVAGQVSYGYDLSGRLLQASDGSSATPYAVGYDTAGRANSYTDQQGRNTQVQYDGVGNRKQLQWPANTNGASAYYVTYQYDALNRMTEIDENGLPTAPLAKYSWDMLSRQTLITYGDDTTDAYTQYDAGDNLQTLTQTFAGTDNSVTFSYSWFKNHQRQSAGVNNNMFQYLPATGTTSYGQPDVDNGYTSSGSTTFTYDGNHNLTFDGANTLSYDVENRLIQAQTAGWGTSAYLYDPLGHRKQKQVGGGITQFVLAGEDEIADYNGAGVGIPWTLTVRGVGGLPVAAITPATGTQTESVAYYHHDVQGSTVAATTPGRSGAVETYAYSEFGAPVGGSYFAYRFAGYRYDSETGLYYVKARYYSATLGRFLQPDPIGTAGGANLYAYVGNDPINLIDLFGLCSAVFPADSTTAQLAQLVYAEGNGTPVGDLAVASVIENRAISGSSEFPNSIVGVMSQQTKGGNFQFQAYQNDAYNSVGTAAQVSNLSPAACQQYQNAVQAATAALQPDGSGTNTNALYYYDTSIKQPGYITKGLNNRTLVPAPVDGGSNNVRGGYGSPQYYFNKAGH